MNEVFVAICEWYGETNQYGEFKSTDLLGVFSDRQAASDACREHTAELEQDAVSLSASNTAITFCKGANHES